MSATPKKSHLWDRDPFDFYCEPSWASERLFALESFTGEITDPACGIGRIVRAACAAGYPAGGYDIVDRGGGCERVSDFLDPEWAGAQYNFVSNPPFGVADRFVKLAIERAHHKVAMLLPATWHFGSKRAAWLETTPLKRVLALTPRPSMPPGAVILAGEKPGGGTKDFAWYIWDRGYSGPWQGGWMHRDRPA